MHIILCSINRNKIFKKILIVDYISRKSWYSYTQQNMHVCVSMYIYQGFPGGSDGKELTCNAGDTENPGSIPGLGRSPREGNDSQLQYSCLEIPIDRGAWQAAVHGVAELDTTEWVTHAHTRQVYKKWKQMITICSWVNLLINWTINDFILEQYRK